MMIQTGALWKRRAALLGLFGLLFSAAAFAVPDEGMWLLTQLKKLDLTKKGLNIPVEQVYRPGGPSLTQACVQLDGGSAEFVSPDGLLLTNHHVAFEAIQQASTEEHNYVDNGFLASTREEELRAPGYTAIITLSVTDVTKDVLAGLPAGADEEERERHIEKQQRRIAAAAKEDSGDADYLTFSVVEHFNGAGYFLYRRMVLRDIRLVYGPPKSIGEFGGDEDNFMWPRHCGDFSFMRAYVGPDGKPAGYSKDNVPYRPESWLKISTAGIEPGDFQFVIGHPGRTYRHRTSFSTRHNRDVQNPIQIRGLRAMIGRLEKQSEESEAKRLELIAQIKSLNNALKYFVGVDEGMHRYDVVERKLEQERKLTEWLAKHPDQKKRYGQIFDKLAEIYASLEGASISTRLARNAVYQQARRIVEFGVEKAKPDAERLLRYKERRWDRILRESRDAFDDDSRKDLIDDFVEVVSAFYIVADEHLPAPLKAAATGLGGEARKEALERYAKVVLEETKIFDTETRMGWFELPAEKIQELEDPLLAFARSMADFKLERPSDAELNRMLKEQRRLYYEAQLAMTGKMDYPDANSTIRFTYGYVEGYKPRDGVEYDPITTLSGVIEKETGKAPFASPKKLIELYEKKDFGRWVDKNLGDVPVAFTNTTDVTGGNSGSPVMNSRGEVVGVVFDGNYEAMSADWFFIPRLNRTIAVDIRYVLFIVDKFANAPHILKELGVNP